MGGGPGVVHTWVLRSEGWEDEGRFTPGCWKVGVGDEGRCTPGCWEVGDGRTRGGTHLGIGKCSWFGTPDTTGQFYFLCSSVSSYIKI